MDNQHRFHLETTPAIFWARLGLYCKQHSGLLSLQEQRSLQEPELVIPGGRGFLDSAFYWRAYVLGWDMWLEMTALSSGRLEVVLTEELRADVVVWPRLEDAIGEWYPMTKRSRRASDRPLGTQGGTMERVKTARDLVERGTKKTEACKRAHVDPRTYDRYVESYVDWENMETDL